MDLLPAAMERLTSRLCRASKINAPGGLTHRETRYKVAKVKSRTSAHIISYFRTECNREEKPPEDFHQPGARCILSQRWSCSFQFNAPANGWTNINNLNHFCFNSQASKFPSRPDAVYYTIFQVDLSMGYFSLRVAF